MDSLTSLCGMGPYMNLLRKVSEGCVSQLARVTDLKVARHTESFAAIIAFVPFVQVFLLLSHGHS